jgi:hypothetical protein
VLEKVNVPVNIYGLWGPTEENKELLEVIDLYLGKNRNIHLQVVDPDKNPGLVMKYDKTKQGIPRGSVVVEGAKGFKVITPTDMYDVSTYNGRSSITGISMERRITSALLFVGTGETLAVYEISGHEELPLASLSMLETVERENYALKQLNLIQSDIPADASALILNGPRADLSQGEADKILNYLEKGGRLLALVDYRVREADILNGIFASYGIRFDYGVLSETVPSYTAGTGYLEVPDLEDHDITNPLAQKQSPVLLSFAMGLSELSTKRRTVEIKPLLTSSPSAFLRTNIAEESASRTSSDVPGPITVAMTAIDPYWIQGNEAQARIVAIACGSILEPVNYYQQIPGNLDFFMNSLTWLEDRPETLSVRSKSLFVLPMRINGLQMIIYGGIFVALIPLAFFAAGLITWLKRRHL